MEVGRPVILQAPDDARPGRDGFVGAFSCAETPRQDAERGLRPVAREAMPELRKLPAP